MIRLLRLPFIAVWLCLVGPVTADAQAPVSQCASDRCVVVGLNSNYDRTLGPRRESYDFDNDGQADSIQWGTSITSKTITVALATGQLLPFSIACEPPGGAYNSCSISDYSVISFNEDGSFPSIVISATGYVNPTNGFVPTRQWVIYNNLGTLLLQALPSSFSLTARDVDCTKFPGRTAPVCFFSVYGASACGGARLAEFNADGTFKSDLTSSFGLGALACPSTNPGGRFGLGGSFLDFTRDTWPDLVFAAQHAAPITSTATKPSDYSYSTPTPHGASGEYLRAYVPTTHYIPPATVPPCVYLAGEKPPWGFVPDFIECYEASTATW